MTKREALAYRITSYLAGGGLFNPELAKHDAVRDLLIDCRAALDPSPLSPSVGEKEGDVEQPVAFALRWPNDSRLNLSTVFDTRAEAEKYVELCSLGISIVPLFAALSAHKGAEE